MKKHLTLLVLLVNINTAVFAESFDIGGKEITIPPPDGYVRVTKEMGAVYRVNQKMFDPMNDLLAYYISESDAAIAMEGDVPSNERTFKLKVNKKIKGMVVGSQDFAEFKSMTKKQNQETLESIKSKLPGIFKKTSEGISKEFDLDIALQISQAIPLDPHYESENAIAYSMYFNYGVAVEGSQKKFAVSATATYVNVSGRVIFLYCYAPKDELEWTRNASKVWTESVMASNSLNKESKMLGWVIWSIVCFYALAWTLLFLKDLITGSFNIISLAYKSGRTISEVVTILGIYACLIITFMNIFAKIHLLWLVPLSLLIGIIIGGCITRIITNINNSRRLDNEQRRKII